MEKQISAIQAFLVWLYCYLLHFDALNLFGLGTPGKYVASFYLFSIFGNLRCWKFPRGLRCFVFPLFVWIIMVGVVSGFYINFYSVQAVNISFALNLFLFSLFVSHFVRSPRVLRGALFAFCVGGLTTLVFYFFGFAVSYDGGRATVFDDNQNILAVRLSISMMVAIFFLVSGDSFFKFDKVVFLISIPLFLIFIIDTGSRVGFLSAVVGALIFMLTRVRRGGLTALCIFCVFGGFIFYVVSNLASFELIFDRLAASAEEGNLGGREFIWEKLLVHALDKPFFGHGFSGYAELSVSIFGALKSPHNVVLEIFFYSGFLGLCLFGFFIFMVVLSALKLWLLSDSIRPIVLLIPVFGLLISGQILNDKVSWMVFSFVLGEYFSYKKYRSNVCLG